MSDIHPDVLNHLKTELRQEVSRELALRKHHGNLVGQVRRAARDWAASTAKAVSLRTLLRTADPEHAEKYAEPEGTRDFDKRAAVIADARELLDWLEIHPAVPVRCLQEQTIFPGTTNDAAEDEAEVDRLALEMDVSAQRGSPLSHYRAAKKFGPNGRVTLQVVSTLGTPHSWRLGDPMPYGVLDTAVAHYAKQWHTEHPDAEGMCPYAGSCEACFENDEPVPAPQAADDTEAREAEQLLDAEQAAAAGQLPPAKACGCEAGESCPSCASFVDDGLDPEFSEAAP